MRATRFLKFQGKPPLKPDFHFTQLISEFGKKTAANYHGTFKSWTKPEIDQVVLDTLFDYAQVPEEKVSSLVDLKRVFQHVSSFPSPYFDSFR